MARLDAAALGTHRARHPVHRSQLVEDGAAHPRDGEGLELETALDVEAVDGVDEPEHAVADEIALIDGVGQPGGDTRCDVLHDRRVVDDELVVDLLVPRAGVGAPQLGDVVVDGHARGCVRSTTRRSRSLETWV